MSKIKKTIKRLIHTLGFEVTRFDPNLPGRDPFVDMKRFFGSFDSPIIFDVGANVGQSIRRFKDEFPQSTVFSFEPGPTTFSKLQRNVANVKGVHISNCALGAEKGTLTFYENEYSDMSSFFKPGEDAWGEVRKETDVNVQTVDIVCRTEGIKKIDILKSDTQGYELEVFKGATQMLEQNKIGLIYSEVMFTNMYEDMPGFDKLYHYLTSRNFSLVSFYQFHFQNSRASWTDALFLNRHYQFGSDID